MNCVERNNGYVDMSQGKVVIDYDHKDGPRVIDDPQEILSIADEEATQWRRRLNSYSSYRGKPCSSSYSSSTCSSPGTLTPKSCSSSPTKYQSCGGNTVDHNSKYRTNTSHPWFYENMSREECHKLLQKFENIDGVFLVRTSKRSPDCFVLSFICNQKINHIQVKHIDTENQSCLSLDFGKTKFYDIQQLVEFYQLNSGYLPTKLTYYVVHKSHQNR
ncbi:Growth factor receptor-bound protein 14-like protein [Dinothrombium tinctorium]|uniref:Growth factor receptor-bound protein 14-like protein n=1 Tax=Dinothrombium tinctorium TaxID=1965070 RepID=A0A3S3PLM6_9ACAR|nr:Growth factor receptor-bound protein 14-like protein [Dinothrombium tinctorium]